MDAFELTRPVLAAGSLRVRKTPAPEHPDAALAAQLAAARRFAYQLPLGTAPKPLIGRDRLDPAEARRELERALWQVAAKANVAIVLTEPAAALAKRLARVRAISPPAADAVVALLPVLDAGEPAAAKVAERVAGYLASRA